MSDAMLVLADGSVFRGRSFGADGETFGEMCFNTGLTGYQEVLTDPSYHGQIVAMTYPHQGNYGCNDADAEAPSPWVRGFVVRQATQAPSSWRSAESLPDYLRRHGVVGIEGVDTRRLTRLLRTQGAMTAGITTIEGDADRFLERVRAAPPLEGRDLVAEVTPKAAYDADVDDLMATGDLTAVGPADPRVDGIRVAALDLGMKRNILRCLVGTGFTTRVFGADASAEEIAAWSPDGVFVSNGPGDPSALPYAAATLRTLLERKVPVFGICLGHQVLGTALGGDTYKLKFGHRGSNHPVKSLRTGRVEITTQNHGFAVKPGGRHLADEPDAWRVIATSDADDFIWASELGDVALSHFDLNDGTLEGLRCLEVPAYSVQYHPEAAPGPHDSRYLFGGFADLILGGN